ncbi:MAG: CDP-diacylglycerol--glycerol-3-phosphate 3-phosphatidyltransferase [Peptococcaceae bacterium]|jgi:CDP-diacylglycerol--glycerol-3-phosphate 3-phosphatidyltransferase|nr:CDP-diacylglycerol--glycerol-3-phosphate 3-phosphatidyltransferase [Peptococcaceae bacterium]MBQ2432557.1 CDP-diacylglycerol--glycerol-3-phosphate 3-phosphatidyltransferase [Peptococcaceae bacterium]MBQ5368898.1 CDP-diacylglycerol--glycerol-3-phosphate 3-phosphatidyltransferase [Peptococcaceae bacterium]MBQ5614738.1 CDP-diacylglycerol--glycerol-3-phosphate 3-phosphatidyltransferase [Peptococcaceae bacterium]MBQ5658795.1 CDP-diacylglycerol--glycerol-3-phosphate 3-phosphatidyltransferase [Pept
MNLPNKLTIARMAMVPLFMIALLMNTPASRILATVIFALASLTDMLDGQIARKYNMVTNFGKLMDPLADKVLTAAAMICLVELGDLAAWIAVVIIFREYLITGLRSVAASENIVVAANIWGKVKTVCQMIALMLLMVKPQVVALCGIDLGLWIMYVAVALTIYSGLDYVLKLNKQITWN